MTKGIQFLQAICISFQGFSFFFAQQPNLLLSNTLKYKINVYKSHLTQIWKCSPQTLMNAKEGT